MTEKSSPSPFLSLLFTLVLILAYVMLLTTWIIVYSVVEWSWRKIIKPYACLIDRVRIEKFNNFFKNARNALAKNICRRDI